MNALWTVLDLMLGISATKPDQLNTLQVSIRAVVVFVTLIAYVRIGKKRFLGSATAFDAILLIVIGSIASRAISGTAPFVASLAAALVLILFHWLLSFVARDSPTLSGLIKGHDTPLIKDGRVNRKALREAHMSDDDLSEDLRQQGFGAPTEVQDARLERSGRLSVVKK